MNDIVICLEFVHFHFSYFIYAPNSSSKKIYIFILSMRIRKLRKLRKPPHINTSIGNTIGSPREDISISFQYNSQVQLIDERLFHIHTRDIVTELTQITIFFREFDSVSFDTSKSLKHIYEILTRLRFGYENHEYMKVVQIVTKYLNGMRKFLWNVQLNNAMLYKKIFESTLMAIMFELNSSEEGMC